MLDGKETELLLVVIRGTYHEEWLDNFDSGTQDTHMGFQRAANFVINGMYNYVKNSQNKVDQNADLKILVTGHSRGAATANLVGKTLDGGNTLYNMDFNTNDVFVYTYATPNVTRTSERNSSKYNNIFNIVNPEDFVTKVLPSDWGYGRFGITYVLPSKTTDIKESGNYVNYSSYLTKLRDHFMTLRSDDTKGYIPYSNGMSSVSSYVKDVTNTIQNINEYYMRSLCTYVSGLLQEPNSSIIILVN